MAARSLRKRIPAHDSIPTADRRPLRRSRRAVWSGPGENRRDAHPRRLPERGRRRVDAGPRAPRAWPGRCARSAPSPKGRRPARSGALAAFTFAAQLVNLPILPGTSGHLVGGTLAAAIVGPSRGLLVMAVVLAVQALLFQDGGITAYGANLMAMGAAGRRRRLRRVRARRAAAAGRARPRGGPGDRCLRRRRSRARRSSRSRSPLPGLYPAGAVLPLLLSLHVPIALLEAALTGAILATLARWRPDLLHGLQGAGARRAPARGACWCSALALAAFAAPFASPLPDGLETRPRAASASPLRPGRCGPRRLPDARALARGRPRRQRARGSRRHARRGHARLGAHAPAGSGARGGAAPVRPGPRPRSGLALAVSRRSRAAGLGGGRSRRGRGSSGWRVRRGALRFRGGGSTPAQLVRRLAWLLPFVLDARAAGGARGRRRRARRDGARARGALARGDDRRCGHARSGWARSACCAACARSACRSGSRWCWKPRSSGWWRCSSGLARCCARGRRGARAAAPGACCCASRARRCAASAASGPRCCCARSSAPRRRSARGSRAEPTLA